MHNHRKNLAALSAIAGTLITIGATVTAGGTLYYAFQSQVEPFMTTSSIELRNLNAIRDDDELRITAVLKNTGQTSITSVFIDEISVSDITIKQSDDGVITLDGTGSGDYCLAGGACSSSMPREAARGFSVKDNNSTVTESTLEGGRSNAFVIEIECADALCGADIQREVSISDRLTITLRYNSGDDVLLTDAFYARVQPG